MPEIHGLKRIVPERNKRRKREATMRVGIGAPELVKRGASRYAFSDPYHLAIEMKSPRGKCLSSLLLLLA